MVFAGLLLERPAKTLRYSLRLASREAVVVWVIILGQIVIGLLATRLFIVQRYNVPPSFGQLIEVGFAGGHGTAAAVGAIYEELLDFRDGRDLSFFFATVGLIYGVISGIVYVNIATRKGWTRRGDLKVPLLTGLEARENPEPIAFGRVCSEVIDPLVFQSLILALAMVVGVGLKWTLMHVISATTGVFDMQNEISDKIIRYADNLPLFMFTLMAGLLVREAMHTLCFGDLIDGEGIRRITGAAMEYLIVAAITSMQLSSLIKFGGPVLLLLFLGFLWTGIGLFVIAPRLLPKAYWFELGILNYGMSTATTAQGLMLLRIIDKDLDAGAAEDFALAAPFSAPFIGGGVITLSLPLLLEKVQTELVCVGLLLLIVTFLFVGSKMTDG